MRRGQARLLGVAVLAAALGGAPGCMRCLHPIPEDMLPKPGACPALPQACRNHVYVFLLHGVDPLDYANLGGVRDYLNALGFPKTYYGQMYHTPCFIDEIRRLHRDDPLARFVVIGFSFGANCARELCHAVARDDIPIDLLVYLGGNTLENCPHDRPANACRVVNILACGWIWNGAHFDDAVNVEYEDVYHFGSPTHPHTLGMLNEELTLIASRVPVVLRVPPPVQQLSPPRPVMPPVDDAPLGGEWNFMRDDLPMLPPPRPAGGP
jgi:hypothetical protein